MTSIYHPTKFAGQCIAFISVPLVSLFIHAAALSQELPLEDFIGYPQFNNAKLSPDGKHLALSAKQIGTDLLVIFETENYTLVSTSNTSRITGIEDFWWVSNEDIIFTTNRQYGRDDYPVGTGDLHILNTSGSKKFIIIGPGAGNFGQYSLLDPDHTNDEEITILAVERDGPVAYPVNINRRYGTASTTGANRTGNARLRNGIESPLPFGELMVDHDGEVRLAYLIGPDGTVQLQLRRDDQWSALPSISVPARESLLGDATRILGFNRDNSGIYFIKTGISGRNGLAIYDLISNEETLLYTHEKYDVGASNTVWTSDKREIIGVKFMGATPERYYFSEHPEVALQQQLDGLFPDQLVLLNNFSDDANKALAIVTGSSSPPALFILNRSEGEFRFFTSAFSALPAEQMSPVQPIDLVARDGVELEGFLTRPLDTQEALPLIVIPHSGPHGVRDTSRFNPEVQLLANRGFAVLQINFRGSGGYGRDFHDLGIGNWGSSMVDDVIDGVNWAVSEGYADGNRLCIYGRNYGAYASIMAAARYPDLFQCAVGYAGIYDLTLLSKSDTPFLPWGMPFLEEVLGDDEEILALNSPVNLAGNIQTPLFIAHGEFDVRAHTDHYVVLLEALDAADVEYEALFVEREGHGFIATENRAEYYNRLLDFFKKNLN